MAFALGTKVVTIGDSLTQGGNTASSTKVANQADSIIHWALMDTPCFRHGIYYDAASSPLFSGSNFGIAGDSATMLLNRLPTILRSADAQGAEIAVVLIGTNTGTTDTGLDAKKQRIKTIVEDLVNSGLTVILGTIFPRAVTGTGFSSTVAGSYMTTLLAANEYIRSLAADNVLIWDAWADLIDPQYPVGHAYYGTPLATVTTDGVHLKVFGAYSAAKTLRLILQSLAVSNDLWDGTWFNSSPTHSGNRLLDGSFNGSAGTIGSGVTGQAPTNWGVSISSPVYTGAVSSVLVNNKTGGNSCSIVTTSNGGGSSTGFERLTVSPSGFRVNEPGMTDGKWARLFFKVRIQNHDGVIGAVTSVNRNSTTGVYGYGLEAPNGLEGNEPWPVGTHDGWIVSEAVKYNTSNVFIPYLQIDTLTGVAGSATIEIEAALLLEEQSPIDTFKKMTSLSVLSNARLSDTFFGVNQLQCMGAAYNATTYPNGVPDSLEIVDGWMKATIRQTDPPTFTGIRAEIIPLDSQALGDEVVYSWEMMVKSDEWTEETGQIIIGQLHPKDTFIAAVGFAVKVMQGMIYFDIPKEEPPTESLVYNVIPCCDLKKDVVMKMTVRMKCINDKTGYLEFFIDGKQYVKVSNRGTSYNADAPYFKVGIYDGPHAANFGTKSVRIRNIKVWSGVGSWEETLGQIPEHPQRLVSAK